MPPSTNDATSDAASDTTDRPPSERGPFRTWPRLYAAVLLTEITVAVLFFLFSRAFAA